MTTTFIKQGIWAGVLLCGVVGASAVPVTFQVNMGRQTTLGNFDPATGTVEARGSFNGWGGGFTLTNSPSDTNIYLGTYDIAGSVGSTVEYKFWHGPGDHWETIGNRSFPLPGSPQTLPVVYFDNDSGGTVPVTFRVDMRIKTAEGVFHPGTDGVTARGSFNGWGNGFALASSVADTNIYEGIYDMAAGFVGTEVTYKFVYNDGSDHWESDPNRTFTLQSSGQTLPVDYFDRDSVISILIKAAVFFQVDMNVQVTTGNFDKVNDEVWVRGNKMGWGGPPGGFQLFEDTSRPGIYTNLYTVDSQLTGEQFQYKHTIWRPGTSATVWEDGANKVVVFDGTEPTNADGYHLKTVGPVFFNGISPSDVLSADTTVTFRVNMNGAQTFPGAVPFDPASQGVWINGGFLGAWWTWNTMPPEDQMYDDGTHGDAVAGDKIYSWQYLVPKGAATRVEYKYGIDSSDNEAGFGNNHVRFIRAVGTYVMPVDTFGTMLQEPVVGSLAITAGPGSNVTISWNGRPGVHLQSATNVTSTVWADEPGTDGASSKLIPVGSGNKFFRLVKP